MYAHILPLECDQQPLSHPIYPKSTKQWPQQPRPGLDVQKLWKKYIKKAVLRTDQLLQTLLGRWTVPVDKQDGQYPMIYDALRKTIHQANGTVYMHLPILHADRRTLPANLANPIPSIRTPGYPIDSVAIKHNIIFAQFTIFNSRAIPTPSIRENTHLDSRRSSIHHHLRGASPLARIITHNCCHQWWHGRREMIVRRYHCSRPTHHRQSARRRSRRPPYHGLIPSGSVRIHC